MFNEKNDGVKIKHDKKAMVDLLNFVGEHNSMIDDMKGAWVKHH